MTSTTSDSSWRKLERIKTLYMRLRLRFASLGSEPVRLGPGTTQPPTRRS